jgi:hypothetical protein
VRGSARLAALAATRSRLPDPGKPRPDGSVALANPAATIAATRAFGASFGKEVIAQFAAHQEHQ